MTAKNQTTTYVVFLCGSSNAGNKSMWNGPKAVAVRDGSGATAAERRQAAIDAATADAVTIVYNGQYLDVRPLTRCSWADIDAARERDAARAW